MRYLAVAATSGHGRPLLSRPFQRFAIGSFYVGTIEHISPEFSPIRRSKVLFQTRLGPTAESLTPCGSSPSSRAPPIAVGFRRWNRGLISIAIFPRRRK